eukprot:gene4694-5747_t
MTSYFIDTKFNDEGCGRLRNCQRDALEALQAHFDSSEPVGSGTRERTYDRALCVLPTGTGKSLVMLLVPYYCRAQGQCVILTPRPNISEAVLGSLHRLRELGLLDAAQAPHVMEIVNPAQRVTEASTNVQDPLLRQKLDAAHFLVLNIHKWFSSVREMLERQEVGTLLVDEAHHAEAKSWRMLIDDMAARHPALRVVYLTATPFRGDQKELNARLVYRYPLAEAMRQRYIKRISFHEVFLQDAQYARKAGAQMSPAQKKKWQDKYHFDTAELDECRSSGWSISCAKAEPQFVDEVLQEALKQLARRRAGPRRLRHKMLVKAPPALGEAGMKELVENLEHLATHRAADHAPLFDCFCASYLHSSSVNAREEEIRLAAFQSLGLGDATSPSIDAMIVVDKLTEGYDFPHITVCAVLDPMGKDGFGKFTQFVGRMLRRLPDGDDEDNHGVAVSHQMYDQAQFWQRYLDEETESIKIDRNARGGPEFKEVESVGHTLHKENPRIWHFLERMTVSEEARPNGIPAGSEAPELRASSEFAAALCIGASQSPIDIAGAAGFGEEDEVDFRYTPRRWLRKVGGQARDSDNALSDILKDVVTMRRHFGGMQGVELERPTVGKEGSGFMTRARMCAMLTRMFERPAGDGRHRCAFVLYYAGHGDEEGSFCMEGDANMTFDDLVAVWEARSPATSDQFFIVIADSCFSGKLVERLKQ